MATSSNRSPRYCPTCGADDTVATPAGESVLLRCYRCGEAWRYTNGRFDGRIEAARWAEVAADALVKQAAGRVVIVDDDVVE